MSAPSFSIVIPTYQRRDLVRQALEALTGVSYAAPWEVIVVIDGSTDGTRQALEAQDWPFPLTVAEQANGGLASARNAGAAMAKGEILLFLDDDMRAAPDILDRHAEAYSGNTAAVAGWIGLDEASTPGFLASGVEDWTMNALEGAQADDPFLLYGGHFSVRRAAFERCGGFDAAYTSKGGYGREDTDLAVRLLGEGSIARAPQARAWQVHTVPAGEMLARSRKQGMADTRFARKHPRHAAMLLEQSGANRTLDRLVLRPLARWPFVPGFLKILASRNANRSARLFDVARRVLWWRGVREAGGYPRSREVLALGYHAIADHGDDPVLAPYSIPPEMFAGHVRSLIERGFHFVDADTALAVAKGEARIPHRSVLLTFDDGYADLPDAARRFLVPNGIPALAFLVSQRLGQSNLWDQPAGAHEHALMDRDGALTLHDAGVTLGSHSRTHADLKGLPDTELEAEVAGPRDDFARDGLPVPSHFAYPFGEKDTAAISAVANAGYAAGWALADRRVDP